MERVLREQPISRRRILKLTAGAAVVLLTLVTLGACGAEQATDLPDDDSDLHGVYAILLIYCVRYIIDSTGAILAIWRIRRKDPCLGDLHNSL